MAINLAAATVKAASSTFQVNGTLDAGQINVLNRGWGGNGVTAGGNADGGDSTFIVNGGSANVTDSASIDASAMGGIARSGPDGNADAGSVYVASYNGGSLTGGDFSLRAWGDTDTGSVEITTDDCDCSSGTIEVNNLTLESSADLDVPTIGGDIIVADKLELNSRGSIAMADVTAGRLDFEADGSVTGGDINVTDRVEGHAEGTIVLGNITAGPGLPEGDTDFSVGITSKTSITVGDVTAAGNVGFATLGRSHHRQHQRRRPYPGDGRRRYVLRVADDRF